MSGLSANVFRRITLGMALVGSVLMSLEDGKITKEEIVMVLNQLFQGLGAEVNFSGLDVKIDPVSGALIVAIPPEILKRLEFKV